MESITERRELDPVGRMTGRFTAGVGSGGRKGQGQKQNGPAFAGPFFFY